jgi:hypothetical protein
MEIRKKRSESAKLRIKNVASQQRYGLCLLTTIFMPNNQKIFIL